MSKLKVIALISGGKDSFFSMLHCLSHGHEIVALANLYPDEDVHDLDSYMYQTVGHKIIPLYEKALGLPLFRQKITGSAIDQSKEYGSRPSNGKDEVDSLYELLSAVKRSIPDANAVSTGAILSDYQRTRVESVALRLGLTPLAFLWQYPFLPPYSETSLLADMAVAGQDARIIKVASGGMDDTFLWQNVADPKTISRLLRASARFSTTSGGAALGEGGEYETLAIDGPSSLWKGSIRVTDEHRTAMAGDAGVASLAFTSATVEMKDSAVHEPSDLRQPPMLDDKFEKTVADMTAMLSRSDLRSQSAQQPVHLPTWLVSRNARNVTVSNATGQGNDVVSQISDIMTRIIEDIHIDPTQITFTTILLRNMSDFAPANTAYGRFFTRPNPPSRVTLAVGILLEQDILVSLSVIARPATADSERHGLHVQSRSYWAPANIGPYSQAIAVPSHQIQLGNQHLSIVHIAGQIPLEPSTMEFPIGPGELQSLALQSVLSLQHLWRIGQIMDVRHWLGAVAFVSARSTTHTALRVKAASQAWRLAYQTSPEEVDEDDDDGLDAWDRAHGRHAHDRLSHQRNDAGYCRAGPDLRDPPPCFVAEVDKLPRSAEFEWFSAGIGYPLGGLSARVSRDQHLTQLRLSSGDQFDQPIAGWIAVDDVRSLDRSMNYQLPSNIHDYVFTLLTTASPPAELVGTLCANVIPCFRIWNAEQRPLAALLMYRVT